MKKTKIKTDGTQLFTMSVGKEADEAYEKIKPFLNNKKYRLRKKFRGGKANFNGDVKKEDATWVAVYLDRKYTEEERQEKSDLYLEQVRIRKQREDFIREQAKKELLVEQRSQLATDLINQIFEEGRKQGRKEIKAEIEEL